MNIIIPIITAMFFGIGLLGTLLPGIPGVGLVYAAIVFYAIADKFTSIEFSTVLVFGLLTIFASIAQYVGSIWGAKYAGAKTKALAGTLIGSLMGTFGGPLGIFIGAFIGALVGALLENTDSYTAVRVAFLSVIGILSGTIIQLFLSIVLIISFLIAIFF